MFQLATPIAYEDPIAGYLSDEIHITGKASGAPRAVLSFVPVNAAGERLTAAPTAVITLTGSAYNAFYAEWTDEPNLYMKAKQLVFEQISGASLSGVDLSRLASPSDLSVGDTVEVLNPE